MHHEHATPDVGHAGRVAGASAFGGPSLASIVAGTQPMAPTADMAGTLASALAQLPGSGEVAGEPQGPAGEEGDRLSPFSVAPFLPLSGVGLARAASTPGSRGEEGCLRQAVAKAKFECMLHARRLACLLNLRLCVLAIFAALPGSPRLTLQRSPYDLCASLLTQAPARLLIACECSCVAARCCFCDEQFWPLV